MKKTCLLLFAMLTTGLAYTQDDGQTREMIRTLDIRLDEVYGYESGMALYFDCYIPEKTNGASVIFVNSGGFESGRMRFADKDSAGAPKFLMRDELMILPCRSHYPPLAQYSVDGLLHAGITVFDIHHPSSPKFDLTEITSACMKAVRYIRRNSGQFSIDTNRMGVFGASSGGYLASYIGLLEPGIRSVVVFYPAGYDWMTFRQGFPEVYQSLGCLRLTDTLALDQLSLKHHVHTGAPEFLIIFGDADYPFITADSEELAKGLRSKNVACEMIVRPGTGHEFRNQDGYQPEHGDFAREKMVQYFIKSLVKSRSLSAE